MSSENQNLIQNILPFLESIGWNKIKNLEFEKTCKIGVSIGRIDVSFRYKGRQLAVLEVKKKGKNRTEAIEQAKKYAIATKTPIALATDGSTYFDTFHIKHNMPLKDFKGQNITFSTKNFLTPNNLIYFSKISSLKRKVKSSDEMKKIFKKLNQIGKDIGLTTGIERTVEIAKFIFIKMLCDNTIRLEINDWEYINTVCDRDKIKTINDKLEQTKEILEISKLNIDDSKIGKVKEIIELLNDINFNYTYYDINGTLFEEFLSERARGRTTNDLGQYFTPKEIVKLLYALSKYKKENTVYDPYCGTAGILIEFFIQNTQTLEEKEKRTFGKNYLYGNEITSAISHLAKMNMVLAGDGHSNIENIDSLHKNNKYIQQDKKFDIVITNIPFDPVTPTEIKTDYFNLSYNSSDLSHFIEHCINRCKIDGRVVLIVGKGFLTEKSSKSFRENLLKKYDLEAVYLLYEGVFAPYTEVFSCIFVINKTTPRDYIDFFSVKDTSDITFLSNNFDKDIRYTKGVYKIKREAILSNPNCDLRGKIYLQKKEGKKIKDLVEYVPYSSTNEIGGNKKKLTTPNAIQDGIYLIDSQSTKRKNEGEEDSFTQVLKENAIVISRITNKRKGDGRYLGSAFVGDNIGDLVTQEYHQFILKDKADLYFILHYMRSELFQEIIELASGTGGQQRIEPTIILEEPIDSPTPEKRKKAQYELEYIEKKLKMIKQIKKDIENMKITIKNN